MNATPATVRIIEAAFPRATDESSTLFVKVKPYNIERLESCLRAIGSYNSFRPEVVIRAFHEHILPHIPENYLRTMIEVGREYSPVLYIHMPECLNDGWPSSTADTWREHCGRFARAANADEAGSRYNGNPNTDTCAESPRSFRVWWD